MHRVLLYAIWFDFIAIATFSTRKISMFVLVLVKLLFLCVCFSLVAFINRRTKKHEHNERCRIEQTESVRESQLRHKQIFSFYKIMIICTLGRAAEWNAKTKHKHKRYKNILFICDWVCACHPHFELLLWYTKEKCAEEIDSCQCAQSAHIEANDMRFVVQFLSHSTVCVFVLSVWAMLEPLAETKIHHESRIHHRKRYVPRMAIVSFSILNLFSFYILHAIILITKREHNFDAVGRKGNMELFRNISLMRMNAWMHYE